MSGGSKRASRAAEQQAAALREQTAVMAQMAEQQRQALAAEKARNDADAAARQTALAAQQADWEQRTLAATTSAEADQQASARRRTGRMQTVVAGGAGEGESLGSAAQAPGLRAVLG